MRRCAREAAQMHGLGCGVACVAAVLKLNYEEALDLFKDPKKAWTKGYYCRDLVFALEVGKKKYSYKYLKSKSESAASYAIFEI